MADGVGWVDTYSTIGLMAAGLYMTLIGFVFHPTKLKPFTLRLHNAVVGFAFGLLYVLQGSHYKHYHEPGYDKAQVAGLMLGVPIACALVWAVFYHLSAVMVGSYVWFLTTKFIEAGVYNYDYALSLDGVRLSVLMGFFGALVLYKMSTSNIDLPVVFFTSVAGLGLAMTGLSCTHENVVDPMLIQIQDNLDEQICLKDGKIFNEMIPFFLTMYIGGLLATALQKFLGRLIVYLITKETAPKYHFSGHKELRKTNKEVNEKSQQFLHSLWYYVRNKGESMSFNAHEKTMKLHLNELGLKQRDLDVNEPSPDSQFVAIADQLNMLYRKQMTPQEVRMAAVEWLEDRNNWEMLSEVEDDLFSMKGLDQRDYCEKIRNGAWGDFITLQAMVEHFQTEIVLVTSVSEPTLVQFPLLQKKTKGRGKRKNKKMTFKTTASLKDSDTFVLIGSDGGSVVIQEVVAELSPVLKQKISEAKERGSDEISFEDSLSSRALRSIVEQLEAHYYIKTSAISNPDIMAAHRHLDLMGKFGPDVAIDHEEQSDKAMMLCHYWGYHYGSLDIGLEKPGPTELDEKETRMRVWYRHYPRIIANRIMIILTIPAGIWWVLWMAVWGYNFNSFFEGVEYILFIFAEFINLVLGCVFNFNFWNPVHRKWRSINHLEPPFVETLVVNCLISHYSEPCEDTARTVLGALRMKATEETSLRVWICDDGFWKFPPKPAPPPPKPWYSKVTGEISGFVRFLLGRQAQPDAQQVNVMPGDDKSKEVEMEEKEKVKPIPGFSETFKGEEDIIRGVWTAYGCHPTPLALKMIRALRKELYRYYSEKLLTRVDIDCDISLKTEEDIVRSDCARGTLRYQMFAKYPGTDIKIKGPEIVLVGRIKPSYHHYKAGNHNNIFFNEKMDGEFVMFLDNDMKPKPDFLLRTLPWFYFYHEPKKRYFINKGIAYIQTPQFFKESTIAGERDHLGGRNSVFFQGIQLGRDGYELSAFAGTNAIFRLGALHTIGGVPYGSLTEDAHTSYLLHKYGYRSIYVEDKLAVGISPVTVANTMQQRGRWCKGSVQMFFLHMMPSFLCGLKKKDRVKWSKPNPFPIETKEEIALYGVPKEMAGFRELLRRFYAVDTTAWPFSALTAVMYMLVAFIFLISGSPPITFDRSPLGYAIFLVTFLPYYVFKIVSQVLSYEKVNSNDVWVSQEIWYSYSFAAIYGIVDALKEHFTGKGLGGWGVTGEGTRTGKLEYCNFFVVVTLVFCILVRLFIWLFSADKNQNLAQVAAMFFAGTIVLQMWPIVATTMYEWVYNSHLKPEDKVDLKRFEIPKYILFSGVLIFVIIVSQFFQDLDLGGA